jgi:hypothetical protein
MKTFKIILAILIALPLASYSQCRSFTKNKCLPMLDGYVQNDNYNSAVLIPGDEAELLLTFYANKEYRMVVCAHPRLGEVEFEVLDSNQELIYASKDAKTPDKNIFDFKMTSTQQLFVRIRVPEPTQDSAIVPEGCVSVMIGFKD